MAKKKLRVLALYGGDAAINQRNELLAWLRQPSFNMEARVGAEDAPHTDGAVDQLVDYAIAWADKAIAVIRRSELGAPNFALTELNDTTT